MTDILKKLKTYKKDEPEDVYVIINELLQLCKEAADEIEMLRKVLAQYRDDLMYPPTGEQRERRIKMVKKFLEGK